MIVILIVLKDSMLIHSKICVKNVPKIVLNVQVLKLALYA